MKGVEADKNALRDNVSISSSTRVIAEINQNRYNDFDQAYVDANLSAYYGAVSDGLGQDYYRNRFPVSSVVNAIRPQSSGMAWARKMPNSATQPASRPYNVIHSVGVYNSLGTAGTASTATAVGDHLKVNPRLYYVGPGIAYQNYSKQSVPVGAAWTSFSTDIKYTTAFWTNKISIGFENTMGDPSASNGLSVSVQLEGGSTWEPIGSSLSIDSDGRLNLYRTGTAGTAGTWVTSKPAYSHSYWDSSSSVIPTAGRIQGVRVSSATPSGPVTLIEVRPSLITDITHRVVSWDWTANIAEQDSLHPIGTVSSNTGSIVLANGDQDLSPQERSSTVCRIAELSREYCEFAATVTVTPGATSDVPQFYAFSSLWQDSSDNNYSLDLMDIIGIMQEIEAPQLVLENTSPTQAIWRAMDMVGLGPVKIRRSAGETESPYTAVYADKDQTLWDFIKSICADSKYSVYADEEGFINIATNSYIFDSTRSSEWTFYGEDSGVSPFADIEEATIEKGDAFNTVNLTYSPVKPISSDSDPKYEGLTSGSVVANIYVNNRELWRPEKDVSLGLATLSENMNSTSSGATAYIKVYDNAFTAGNWDQFSGYLLIDQEIIKYESVEFSHIRMSDNTLVKRKVKSRGEFLEMLSGAKGRVGFTGYLYDTTRGQFGTTPASHSNPISSWSKSPTEAVTTGTSTDATTGVVTRSMKINGSSSTGRPTAYRNFGNINKSYFCNVTISSKSAPYSAGMVVWPQVSGSSIVAGMWVRLTVGKGVRIYKTLNGSYVAGSEKTIAASVPYNKRLEVRVTRNDTPPKSGWVRWKIYINKTYIGDYDVKDSGLSVKTGLGLFTSGKTLAYFDYAGGSRGKNLIASNSDNVDDLNDMVSNILSDKVGLVTRNEIDLDDFDAAVRAVYYEKINFQKGPARNVQWYPYSNLDINREKQTGKYTQIARSGDVAYAIQNKSPWYAEIILANTSNRPVLISGNDKDHYPLVYGKVFERGDPQKATKEDKKSIARYGIRKFDNDLPWTSNRATAEKIAQQLLDVSSDGTQYIQVTSFTNHLISLCDAVTIQYAVKNLDATQKFVVCEINSSWSDGLQHTFKVVKQTSA